MNPEINNVNNSHQYVDVLYDFCVTFEQEWAQGSLKKWSPYTDENKVETLSRAQDDLYATLDKVVTLYKYTQNQPLYRTQAEDERTLDRLKCILHDLMERLQRIKTIFDFVLTNKELPQKTFRDGYETVKWQSRQIDALIQKAFPLLKANKDYIDVIDWHEEFESLK